MMHLERRQVIEHIRVIIERIGVISRFCLNCVVKRFITAAEDSKKMDMLI